MKLDLTNADARIVHTQLLRRLQDLEMELAHTDRREFKQALAEDVTRLRRIADHIAWWMDDTIDEAV